MKVASGAPMQAQEREVRPVAARSHFSAIGGLYVRSSPPCAASLALAAPCPPKAALAAAFIARSSLSNISISLQSSRLLQTQPGRRPMGQNSYQAEVDRLQVRCR